MEMPRSPKSLLVRRYLGPAHSPSAKLPLEGCAATQMVDRMDQGAIPLGVVTNSYEALYKLISRALYRTHVEGKLKVGALPLIPRTPVLNMTCSVSHPRLG